MSQGTTIDDGYEDDPWKDDPAGELVPVEDFLPSPEQLRNAVVYVRADGATFFNLTKEDIHKLDQIAMSQGVSSIALITGVLHDFASGQLIKRPE